MTGSTYGEDGFYIFRVGGKDDTLASYVELGGTGTPVGGESEDPVPEFENGILTCMQNAANNYIDAEGQPIANGGGKRAKSLDCSSLAEWDDAMVDEGTRGEEKWKEDRVGENMVEH